MAYNMGSMTKPQIEEFFNYANAELGYGFTLVWCDDRPICFRSSKEIYLNRIMIGLYPWQCKEIVLHEFAHVPNEDDYHTEVFYEEYCRLLKLFITHKPSKEG